LASLAWRWAIFGDFYPVSRTLKPRIDPRIFGAGVQTQHQHPRQDLHQLAINTWMNITRTFQMSSPVTKATFCYSQQCPNLSLSSPATIPAQHNDSLATHPAPCSESDQPAPSAPSSFNCLFGGYPSPHLETIRRPTTITI
jgi:hypothetical protein